MEAALKKSADRTLARDAECDSLQHLRHYIEVSHGGALRRPATNLILARARFNMDGRSSGGLVEVMERNGVKRGKGRARKL
jgi:hypothetical protein